MAFKNLSALPALTNSLKIKILWPYIILIVGVAIVSVYAGIRLVFSATETLVAKQLVNTTITANQIIITQEEERLTVLRQIVATDGMAEAFLEADHQANFTTLERFITAIALNNAQIDSILLLNDTAQEILRLNRVLGQDRADFLPLEKGSNADYSTWHPVNQVITEERIISSIRVQGVTGADDILYTIGLMKHENEIIGVVLVGSYLKNSLDNIKLTTLADATFYGQGGQVRDTTLIQAEAHDSLALDPGFYQQAMTNLEIAHTRQIDLSGQPYALIFIPFQLRGGIIGLYSLALRTDVAVTVGVVSRNLFITIIGITLIILLGLTFMLTRQIIDPLTQLAKITQATAADIAGDAAGGLTTGSDIDHQNQSTLKRQDEIGLLATTFAGLIRQLREKSTQLQKVSTLRDLETDQTHLILNTISEGLVILDQKGQIRTANPAAQQILTTLTEDRPTPLTLASFLKTVLATTPQDQDDTPDSNIETDIETEAKLETAWLLNQLQEPDHYKFGRHQFRLWAVPIQMTPDEADIGAVIVVSHLNK